MTLAPARRSHKARRRGPASKGATNNPTDTAARTGSPAAARASGTALATCRTAARRHFIRRPSASITRKPSQRFPGVACQGEASNKVPVSASNPTADSGDRAATGSTIAASTRNAAPRFHGAAYFKGIAGA